MKTKLLTLLICVSANSTHAQKINGPTVIDSLLSVINASFRNDQYLNRNDSGDMMSPETHSSIGTYKRSKYFDKQTGDLKIELFLQKFKTGITNYDSYYYWGSKMIFVERLSYTK